ncbi:hypothetical protein Lalb_Chr10g0095621 [Lupinus albus]|uniref:Uncharacterized protein n=1 Tax=Lupinus albus TaxID=3870 RepID=A0A6A4PV74_LUPAL|nr:hypothetical protein Lalb_Chr10g0095621 [Lupinus albus]
MYYILNWDFLEKTLNDFRFPPIIVSLFIWCVRSRSMSFFGLALGWTISTQPEVSAKAILCIITCLFSIRKNFPSLSRRMRT